MINTSDRPIVLLTGIDLHRAVQSSIGVAIELIERQLNRRSSMSVKEFAFYRLFGAHNQVAGVRLDAEFVEACFDSNQGDAHNTGTRAARQKLAKYLLGAGVAANGLASLKRGIKLMLVELWRTKTILLPTTFTIGAHFPIEMFKHPLLEWLKGHDPALQSDDGGTADARRLYFYGPRLLWTTDWSSPSDISLEELSSLQRASRLYLAQKSSVVIAGGTQLPFTILAAQALQQFPAEVQFNALDLARYFGQT